jgi:hypothetical protein
VTSGYDRLPYDLGPAPSGAFSLTAKRRSEASAALGGCCGSAVGCQRSGVLHHVLNHSQALRLGLPVQAGAPIFSHPRQHRRQSPPIDETRPPSSWSTDTRLRHLEIKTKLSGLLMTAILGLLAKPIQFELGPSVGKDLVRFQIATG